MLRGTVLPYCLFVHEPQQNTVFDAHVVLPLLWKLGDLFLSSRGLTGTSLFCKASHIQEHDLAWPVLAGRETGMDIELDDIPVHSLVPEPLRETASVDDFMARLPEFDGDLADELAAADAAGECLRFVGACPGLEPRPDLLGKIYI